MPGAPISSILMFFLAAIFGAFGQYFYKSGADLAIGGALTYLLNFRIWLGVACYVAVMVLFVGAFKRGGSMAALYPIYATTFVWGAIISHFAFGTEVRGANLAGMGLIFIGMYLLAL